MTYGYELKDDPVTHECQDHEYREKHAWPGRLCEVVGMEGVVNDSVPGGANDRILRTTFDWVLNQWLAPGKDPASLLVVIGWSHPMRREFYIDGEWCQIIPYHDYPHESVQKLTQIYREVAWHDLESVWRWGTQVLAMQSFLCGHGIPFLFFDAIVSFRDLLPRAGDGVAYFKEWIDAERYLNLHKTGMNMADQLSSDERLWRGRHPSDTGHQAWAEMLADHLRRAVLTRVPKLRIRPSNESKEEVSVKHRIKNLVSRYWSRQKEPFIYP